MRHLVEARRTLLTLVIALLLWPGFVPAHEERVQTDTLGTVHFPVSCSAPAARQFERAVAMLHSFWYEEALTAFTAVTGTDPSCAMGYWGIAMSLYYPLWYPPSEATLKKGAAAVAKAMTLGGTQREKDYIAAIGAFYADADRLDHRARALAYEAAMERLYLRYPDDREAAVFYALALNAAAEPTDKAYARQLKAAAILEKVFAEEPNHPGAAHYIIHSYDYSPLADRALAAARAYSKIAPSVPHALHMPAHIFTRLGLWQESIDSNRASAAAGKEYFAKAGRGGTWDQTLHAMDYLMYAYLQGAQDEQARRVLEELGTVRKAEPESLGAAYAIAAIPARFAIERRQWSEAASLAAEPIAFPWDRYPWAEAIPSFARALGSARTGKLAGAQREIEKLAALRDVLAQAKNGYWSNQVEVQRRAATALLAHAQGNDPEAIDLLRSAADLEAAMDKHPVTPAPIVPARELLGELLLDLNRPEQSLKEFEASLAAEPNRFWSLYGAGRSAELSGDAAKAKGFYTRLVALCERADTERPELRQAKAFLAR